MTESVHRFRTMVYEIEVLMCTGHEWYWSDLSTHSHGVSWVNLVQPTKGGSIMVHTVKNLLRTKNCACYETEWDSNSTMVMADNHTISTQILHSPNGELMSMLGMNMMWKSLEIFHMSSEIRATLKKYVVRLLATLLNLSLHDWLDQPPCGYSNGVYDFANSIYHGHADHPWRG